MSMIKKAQTNKKRRNKKLLLLFTVFGISIVVFVTTTYAWFVGMGNVKVNSFNINLKAEKDLEISLDGYTWDESVNVTEDTIKAHSNSGNAYENNTNHWVGENGLVPVSTSGDNSYGRLNFFSKSSIITTDGGYRIVANKIDNFSEESDHYVTFDIFVKNKSGDVYNPIYNILDDENIYLKTDSLVVGSPTGSNNYGIQNSARVAFVQLGRISLDDLESGVTPNISCIDPLSGDKYTPLCNEDTNHYRTMIWEPNDMNHDTRLLNYYDYICKNKIGPEDYEDEPCISINGNYVPTYTIRRDIISDDFVDVYDGLNSYENDIKLQSLGGTEALQNTVTFTDTMKATGGEYTFMKLHPHSVTKIRVYVFLEGQDVDNYDLITNDQNITVNFSLTKEREYTSEMVPDEHFIRFSNSIAKSSDSLYNTVKASAISSSSSINYNNAPSQSGVYQYSGDPSVYFYRGNVTNNNVIFGGFCWQIVRTTNTGGVKLIYNGTPSGGKCTGNNSDIGQSAYNSYSLSRPMSGGTITYYNIQFSQDLAGYTFNLTNVPDDLVSLLGYTNLEQDRDSDLKSTIDSWYASNMTSYTDLLEDTPYCNDKVTVPYDTNKVKNLNSSYLLYASSYRSADSSVNMDPVLSCRKEDAYTVSTAYGNGKLTYPVATITSDEFVLAGATEDAYNTYLNGIFWTMTPVFYYDYDVAVSAGVIGMISTTNAHTGLFVKPMISLKNGMLVDSGDGTSNSPYVVTSNV